MTQIKSEIVKSEQGMTVLGSLVFANITTLLEKGSGVIEQYQGDSFVIDCTEMKRIDSAGIALLIEWQRQSKNCKIVCRFEGLSNQAQSLIKAYRLQSLIAA